MKAVVWRGDRTLDIETVEDARLEAPTDVVMHLTSTAICGTDLHIYEGRMGEVDGMVIGHEPLGVVEEVGSAVVSIHKGDRVVVPTHICCGFCYNCVRGYSASCLTTNPGSVGAAYGYPGMGRDPDERYNTQLRDLIIAGRARPSQIVSHRLPLSQAPAAFQKFDQRIDGYIKVILDPQR